MRVVVIFQRFGPYHHARLRAADASIDEIVKVEVDAADSTYGWSQIPSSDGFERVTLFSREDRAIPSRSEIRNRMRKTLRLANPDVVAVPGWSSPAARAAMEWCSGVGTPAILMSDSSQRDFPRTWLREWPKSRFVKLSSSALVAGRLHSEYMETLGMPKDRIFLGYDVVDNDHFWDGASRARSSRNLLSKGLGLARPFFLAVSRFIEKKNLPLLMTSYASYRPRIKGEPWDLVLLGDGSHRPQLLDLRQKLGLEDSIHFPGFGQYDELPKYYGLAEAFIHASTIEQWGLVVNEAMAAGLPVLVSDRCGCVPELLEHGGNGYTFDPLDKDDLAACLNSVHSDPKLREQMGQRSREIIADWDVKRFATGLAQAAETAREQGPVAKTTTSMRLVSWALSRAPRKRGNRAFPGGGRDS